MSAKRNPPGGYPYHVLNRANHGEKLFETAGDYWALLNAAREAQLKTPLEIIEYCVMPNHWHFLMWPKEDGQLAEFMHQFTTSHAVRWNRMRGATGHVYQGPYKPFAIEGDQHYWSVRRYIVRNALRANLVASARNWPWASLHARIHQTEFVNLLSDGPLKLPANWEDFVDQPQTEAELAALRRSTQFGVPYGNEAWVRATARALGIEHTLRSLNLSSSCSVK